MSKECTPLWREAHFEVKMHKTPQCRTTFGSCDVERVHAVVARSTFRSQNVKNTRGSDHFWMLRCRSAWQVQGIVDLVESEEGFVAFSTTTTTTVQYTTLYTFTTLHYTTLHYTTFNYIQLLSITLHYTTLHFATLHYTTLHYIPLHYTTLTTTTSTTTTTTTTILHLHYATLHYTNYTTLHSTTLR